MARQKKEKEWIWILAIIIGFSIGLYLDIRSGGFNFTWQGQTYHAWLNFRAFLGGILGLILGIGIKKLVK
jgi:hypothetical protein